MMLNALWAFATMSNLSGLPIALFAGIMTHFGKIGIVKVIFISAAASILYTFL